MGWDRVPRGTAFGAPNHQARRERKGEEEGEEEEEGAGEGSKSRTITQGVRKKKKKTMQALSFNISIQDKWSY